MAPTHRGVFGSRYTGTGGSSFVPVQSPPDFSLSHLLEEISTYFQVSRCIQATMSCVALLGRILVLNLVGTFFHKFLDSELFHRTVNQIFK